MRLPYIVLLVLAGVLYGIIEPGRLTFAFGHGTLYVFLPLLLFEAAWNLNFSAMRRNWAAITTLAGPGVLVTALLVAGALSLVRVPFVVALLVGAILSATDPIAVVAVFRRIRVPVTLATIVECESLFNDAVAVVLYRGILAVVLGAKATGADISRLALGSLVSSAAGIGIGIAIALLAATILRKQRNAGLQIAATLLCAYGAYFAADAFGASGIFATISCGIALRFYERSWITLQIVEDVNRFWDVGALAANTFVFFLVGAALDIREVVHDPAFVIAALAGVALSRIVVASLLLPGGLPVAWLDVIRVAGMRGALSLALALALPKETPFRETIIDAVFAVSLATLIASSVAVPRTVGAVARSRKR